VQIPQGKFGSAYLLGERLKKYPNTQTFIFVCNMDALDRSSLDEIKKCLLETFTLES